MSIVPRLRGPVLKHGGKSDNSRAQSLDQNKTQAIGVCSTYNQDSPATAPAGPLGKRCPWKLHGARAPSVSIRTQKLGISRHTSKKKEN